MDSSNENMTVEEVKILKPKMLQMTIFVLYTVCYIQKNI